MRLRLRVIREGVDIIDMPAIGKRRSATTFAEAGAKVYELLDPFVAISALSETGTAEGLDTGAPTDPQPSQGRQVGP